MSNANLPMRLSLRPVPPRDGFRAIPDPISQCEYYQGVIARRVFAYLIDMFLIGLIYGAALLSGVIVSILTFGMMTALIIAGLVCLAPAYHVLSVGGHGAATPGMRLMGLEVRNFDGGPPTKLQAFVQIALFYVTVPTTGGWILLFALFNRYRRAVHDVLSHTVVLRRLASDPTRRAWPAAA